jgi:hypothetical protein
MGSAVYLVTQICDTPPVYAVMPPCGLCADEDGAIVVEKRDFEGIFYLRCERCDSVECAHTRATSRHMQGLTDNKETQ